MQIRELFVKPIDRSINGVIKVGQTDERNVHQELEEYVLTRELEGYFHQFFGVYVDSLSTPTDKIGVWISGFFGSGKSHFLKILSYLLENREVMGRRAVSFFDGSKVKDPVLRAQLARTAEAAQHTDVILFNIDSKAEARSKQSKEAIVQTLQKVFDEHQGYFGSHPALARFERQLDEKGQYPAFQEAFASVSGKPWTESRDAYQFHEDEMRAALEQLGYSAENTTRILSNIEGAYSLSVEGFAQSLQHYLERRGPLWRVLFLVDEVGQYIGENSDLMLNLQTVAEDLGTHAPGRAWLIVTSQESIDSLTGQSQKQKMDFSKIQGRFNPRNRVNLSSIHSDEVIRLRLLDKTPQATDALEALYARSSVALKNQIRFGESAAAMEGYATTASFVSSYPFVPYQFKLLQAAFTAIRQMGSSGKHLASGERSLLDAFQLAALQLNEKELGVLAPFYTFYGAIEGFLDHNIKRVVEGARQNPALEPFDINLLKTLFLIKYVKEVRGDLETLTTLSLEHIEAVRGTLQKAVQASLTRLERQTLIARNGDEYSFLTFEEQDVGREIKLEAVSESKLMGELQKLCWEGVYQGLKAFKRDKRHSYPFHRVLDGQAYDGGGADLSVHLLTPRAPLLAQFMDSAALALYSTRQPEVLICLPDGDDPFSELEEAIQTDAYVARKNALSSSESLSTILRARADANASRKVRIEGALRAALSNARVFAAGAEVTPRSAGSSNPRELLEVGLESLIANTYPKLDYLRSPFDGEAQLLSALKPSSEVQDLDGEHPNAQASRDLLEWTGAEFRRNVSPTVAALLERYTRAPYGWSESDLLGVLLELFGRGSLELRLEAAAVSPERKGLVGELMQTRNRARFTVRPVESVDPAHLKAARDLLRDDFGRSTLPQDPAPLRAAVLEELTRLEQDLKTYRLQIQEGRYPFGAEVEAALKLLSDTRTPDSSAEFFRTLAERRSEWESTLSELERVRAFFAPAQNGLFRLSRDQLRELGEDAELLEDSALLQHVRTAQRILALPDPTREMHTLSGLLAPALEARQLQLEAGRARAMERYSAEVRELVPLVRELGGELREVAPKMLELSGRIQTAQSLQALGLLEGQIKPLAQGETERLLLEMNARKSSGTLKSGEDPRSIITLKPGGLRQKALLETEADVDTYLQAVRAALLERIKLGQRVRVE